MREAYGQPRETDEIKAKLRSYGKLQRRLDNQITRLENLMESIDAVGSTNYSGMPAGSHDGTSRAERYVEQKDELEKKIDSMIQEERELKKELEDLIAQLDNPDEQGVLELKYIDGIEWPDVSELLFGSAEDYEDNPERYMKRTFRIHGAALQRLSRIYRGEPAPPTL